MTWSTSPMNDHLHVTCDGCIDAAVRLAQRSFGVRWILHSNFFADGNHRHMTRIKIFGAFIGFTVRYRCLLFVVHDEHFAFVQLYGARILLFARSVWRRWNGCGGITNYDCILLLVKPWRTTLQAVQWWIVIVCGWLGQWMRFIGFVRNNKHFVAGWWFRLWRWRWLRCHAVVDYDWRMTCRHHSHLTYIARKTIG